MLSRTQDGTHTTPRALFLGSTFAGHRTRLANLAEHLAADSRLEADVQPVSGWNSGGVIERFTALPRPLRGRLRAAVSARGFARLPRPDVIWTSVVQPIVPHLWAQAGRLRRPLILDLDWTMAQRETMATIYFNRPARTGFSLWLAREQEKAAWKQVSVFTPWSRWAADSLLEQGVEASRVRILPPGVDLERWAPNPVRWDTLGATEPLRLLFVGGDFERKGGKLLLDAIAALGGQVEADIVTRKPVSPAPGVRIHRAGPNSPELISLFARAHVFVSPTFADCFGIATIEAMASGLPVIVSNVGGAADIVEHGTNGLLIGPDGESLVAALRWALDQRENLSTIGMAGRRRALQRFDGARNDRTIVDLALELAHSRRDNFRRVN